MVLKGEVKDVGLAEVFQMLSASGREGTLTVASGQRKIHIWFGKGKIRLLREGGVSHTALGKILLRSGRIKPEHLTIALEEQKKSGKLLGQVLVELGFVKQEDVDECVRTQLEEEICNVFLWDDAVFEFTPGPPEAAFADLELTGHEVPFDVNEVILDAARRVDEWQKVLEEIERTRSEFEVVKKGDVEVYPVGFSLDEVKQVVRLVEEVRRVDEIIGRAPMSRLEVARLLVYLLRRGYIRRVERKEEKKGAEEKESAAPADWRLGISIVLDDADLKKRLESLLWGAATKEEAVREILTLADAMVREGKLDEAVPVYRIALDLEPDNKSVRTKLVHLYVLQWRFADAAKVLVEAYRRRLDST